MIHIMSLRGNGIIIKSLEFGKIIYYLKKKKETMPRILQKQVRDVSFNNLIHTEIKNRIFISLNLTKNV